MASNGIHSEATHTIYTSLSAPILLLGVIPFTAAIGLLVLGSALWVITWPNVWVAPLIAFSAMLKIIHCHQHDAHAWEILRTALSHVGLKHWNKTVRYVG